MKNGRKNVSTSITNLQNVYAKYPVIKVENSSVISKIFIFIKARNLFFHMNGRQYTTQDGNTITKKNFSIFIVARFCF